MLVELRVTNVGVIAEADLVLGRKIKVNIVEVYEKVLLWKKRYYL
jgi:hypothetical protein